MRHLKKGRKFGREKNQRTALLKSLARELIMRGRIKTTLAKAKELRSVAEKLVTESKSGSLDARRRAIAFVHLAATKKLFSTIAPEMKERSGGYTRVIRLGRRASDAAEMAIIELVK